MRALDILVVLDIQVPVDDDGTLLQQRGRDVLLPLLDELAGSRALRCALHLSGRLVPWLGQQHPDQLSRLRKLVRVGRIELLGGGFYDPLLAAIPEHDVTGQLGLTASVLEKHTGRRPAGLWLVGRAWSPALTALLSRAGYRYTLVDERAVTATGLDADALDGHYVTERSGFALTVFPIHTGLQRRLADADRDGVEQELRRALAGRERRGIVLAWDGLAGGEELEALRRLLDAVQAQGHWLRLHTPSRYMERRAPSGRVYPAEAVFRRGADDTLRGVGWERFLADYPEVNELHKRMLMASYRVQRMRGAVTPKNADGRRQLQLACSQLWEAQHHGMYWHGEQPGFYDSRARHRAIGRLIAVEELAAAVLSERPAEGSQRSVDFDCDGHPELLFRTGAFQAAVSPRRGGSLTMLDLIEHKVGLQSVLRRHAEPYHVTSGSSEIQLVDDDEDSVEVAYPVDASPDMDAKLWFDGLPRVSFADHFLGAGTTLHNWYRNLFREVGDFVDGEYEIVADAETHDADSVELMLGRSGTVDEGERQGMLRVEKRFAFHRSLPRLRVEYRLANRYYEPVRAHFGVELNVALPGGADGKVSYRAVRVEGDEYAGRPDAPAALEQVTYLELLDTSAAMLVAVYLDDPLDLWVMPVETVHRVGSTLDHSFQGVGLLFHRPADLWGTEEVRAAFKLEIMRP